MKLTAMNKLLMEENDIAKDISCESVVTSELEPTRVAEIVKDRLSWFRECRAVDVMNLLYSYKALEK
ncbi:hypothetical protein Bca52824_037530 [Brassica carinata]|uniref:Uncharacterized protein n=1 Tax=Brassica carinata TaxID=52824 RepID=A0A8X7RMA8_BRACI|nr:hypothetical protein Bca52824_037530 [Brassica carinata]